MEGQTWGLTAKQLEDCRDLWLERIKGDIGAARGKFGGPELCAATQRSLFWRARSREKAQRV